MDARTQKNLVGVHPDLVRVLTASQPGCPVPFVVTEGRRSLARQRQLVARGASKTLNSRHLTGHAIDVAAFPGGKLSWSLPLYKKIADHIKAKANALKVPIIWGGDWRSFVDGPHFELNRGKYPA